MNFEINCRETVGTGKFLKLEKIHYTDRKGKKRIWEAADRIGSNQAAAIIARLMPERSLILIRQFRPPANCMMLEFPAGLVDPGETPAEAALRELKEETGYSGKVTAVGPCGISTAGMSGEAVTCVVVEIDRSLPVEAHPEENEDIETVVVPEAELDRFVAAHIASGGGVCCSRARCSSRE